MKKQEVKISAEVQWTFWFELTRLAAFLHWEWLAKRVKYKTICRLYVNGKLTQEIRYDWRRAEPTYSVEIK